MLASPRSLSPLDLDRVLSVCDVLSLVYDVRQQMDIRVDKVKPFGILHAVEEINPICEL